MAESLPLQENIVLVGFMGTGKSTIGRLVARKLRFQMVDTDRLVEDRARMAIHDIFARHGEEYFRDRETAVLEMLSTRRRMVVSTGGGIVTQPRNVPLLRQLGWVVRLTADPEAIFDRVSRNQNRPLLKVEDPRETMLKLMAQRQPLYEAVAQFTVDGTVLSAQGVADAICAEARRIFGWREPPPGSDDESTSAPSGFRELPALLHRLLLAPRRLRLSSRR